MKSSKTSSWSAAGARARFYRPNLLFAAIRKPATPTVEKIIQEAPVNGRHRLLFVTQAVDELTEELRVAGLRVPYHAGWRRKRAKIRTHFQDDARVLIVHNASAWASIGRTFAASSMRRCRGLWKPITRKRPRGATAGRQMHPSPQPGGHRDPEFFNRNPSIRYR